MKIYSRGSYLLTGVLLTGFCRTVSADVIYDDSVNDLSTRFDPGTLQVGDEIQLAGTARQLQLFSFEYWGSANGSDTAASFAGNVQARVEFYQNNGAPFNGYATPGTSFYDSGWFSVPAPTERNTFVFTAGSDFAAGGLTIPTSDMTFTVQFEGMGAGDAVGVDLYSPPVVGQNTPDYWENDGTDASPDWVLKENPNGVPPVDFASLFEATEANAPDATGYSLYALSFLGLMAFGLKVRRQVSVRA